MSPEALLLATLVAYKVVLVGIGVVCERRTRDGEDFFLGGRRLGPTVAAVSASASSSSAWTLLAVSGKAYATGLSAIWIFPGCVGGFLLNWYVLAPAIRRFRGVEDAVTVSELLAGPRGAPLRRVVLTIASTIVVGSLTVYVASQFQATGKTLNETFDLSREWSIVIGGAVILVYMFLGGFWAVSVTDTLQGFVMALACLVLPIVALVEVGGPVAFVDAFGQLEVDGFQSLTGGATTSAGVGVVVGFLGIGLGYPGQPHVVNRFMALRPGEQELRRARRIAVGWAVVVYAGMLLLGWCGRIVVESTPGASIADHETIFVHVTSELLHPVVAGVMLAAVLSAIMSTADSQLLVAASAVTNDLGLGARSRLGVLARSRLVVVGLGAVAICGALYGSTEIFESVLSAWTALGAAFGPALLATVLWRRLEAWRVALAMVVGFGTSVTLRGLDVAFKDLWPYALATLIVLAPPWPAGSQEGR